MNVIALIWVGTRTTDFAATAAFFENVMGLAVRNAEPDFTILDVPDGATVEIFGPASGHNEHLTHPVAGFEVTDLRGAADELTAAGAALVLPITGGRDKSWLHFRAPDGFVYELTESGTEWNH